MPIVFLHGVTVRQTRANELAETVQSNLIRQGLTLPFYKYFWGGSGVALRWGGDSIPGISAEERREQMASYNEAVSLPDLKGLLISSPLLELSAWRETREFAAFDKQKGTMDRRRAQLQAARELLVGKLLDGLRETKGLKWPERPEEAANFVALSVASILAAAADTRADIGIADLLEPMARALTADLYTYLVPPAQMLKAEIQWETLYVPVDYAVEQTLGGQAGLFGDLLKKSALSLALPLLRGSRGRFMPPVVSFLGDVFVYLSDRDAFLEGMHAVVTRALNESNTPLWIVAHSLGGVIAFDYCSRYPTAVHRLVTVGSQPGLFAEGNLLFARHPDPDVRPLDKRPTAALDETGMRVVPENIERWINVYDFNDMLSFRCAPIFDRVQDVPLTSDSSFPDSHSAYWDRDDTYEHIVA